MKNINLHIITLSTLITICLCLSQLTYGAGDQVTTSPYVQFKQTSQTVKGCRKVFSKVDELSSEIKAIPAAVSADFAKLNVKKQEFVDAAATYDYALFLEQRLAALNMLINKNEILSIDVQEIEQLRNQAKNIRNKTAILLKRVYSEALEAADKAAIIPKALEVLSNRHIHGSSATPEAFSPDADDLNGYQKPQAFNINKSYNSIEDDFGTLGVAYTTVLKQNETPSSSYYQKKIMALYNLLVQVDKLRVSEDYAVLTEYCRELQSVLDRYNRVISDALLDLMLDNGMVYKDEWSIIQKHIEMILIPYYGELTQLRNRANAKSQPAPYSSEELQTFVHLVSESIYQYQRSWIDTRKLDHINDILSNRDAPIY